MPPSIPEVIGKYAIERWIESGGMGDIYLARDPTLDRPVAIKFLREGFDSQELRERFEREARAAGRLSHPNIVTIYEFGECEGRPFIAMEFVPGESLAKLIRRREPLPLYRKLEMMEGLCAGLAHAHRSGMVHRDIKPANLMVDSEGSLKVLDFGIVRMAGSGLTHHGVLVGTVNYMSPEQIAGSAAIDHRSDVFAVGAVLYEVLSYKRAFPGEMAEVLYKIVHAEPEPLATLVPGLDPVLLRAVAKCLDKSIDRRYQDLSILRRELSRVRHRLEMEQADDAASMSGSTVLVRPTPPPLTPPPDADSAARRAEEAQRRQQEEEARQAGERKRQAEEAQRQRAFEEQRRRGEEEKRRRAEEEQRRRALEDERRRQAEEALRREHEAARKRQRDERLQAARQAIEDDDFAQARTAMDEASRLGASPQTLGPLTARYQERHQQADAVRRCLQDAEAWIQAGELDQALAQVEEALRLRPGHRKATELRDRARRLVAERRSAIEAEAAARKREEEERRRVEKERQRAIERWLGDARAARQHDKALAALNQVFELDPGNAAARSLLDGIRREQADQKRTREAQFAKGKKALEAGSFAEAVNLLRPLAADLGDHPGFASALKASEAGLAKAEAERKRQEQLAQQVSQAADRLAKQDFKGAQALLRPVLEQDASNAQARGLQTQIAQAEELQARASGTAERARRLLEQGKPGEAFAELERFSPSHPLIQKTLTDLRAEQKRRQSARERAERQARRRQAVRRAVGAVGAVARDRRTHAAALLVVVAVLAVVLWAAWIVQEGSLPTTNSPTAFVVARFERLPSAADLAGALGLGSETAEEDATPGDTSRDGGTTPADAGRGGDDRTSGGTAGAGGSRTGGEATPDTGSRTSPGTRPDTSPGEDRGATDTGAGRPDPGTAGRVEPERSTGRTDTPPPEREPETTSRPRGDAGDASGRADPKEGGNAGAPKPPPPPPPDPRQIAEQEIRNWIAAYQSAFAQLDADRIVAMHPQSSLRHQRGLLNSARVTFREVGITVEPGGQKAVLTAHLLYEYKWQRSSYPPRAEPRITWNLVKGDGGWVVKEP